MNDVRIVPGDQGTQKADIYLNGIELRGVQGYNYDAHVDNAATFTVTLFVRSMVIESGKGEDD